MSKCLLENTFKGSAFWKSQMKTVGMSLCQFYQERETEKQTGKDDREKRDHSQIKHRNNLKEKNESGGKKNNKKNKKLGQKETADAHKGAQPSQHVRKKKLANIHVEK